MEVHVRNVPHQGTEKGLKNFLKPYLHKLSIQNFNCQKKLGNPYASLTFLRVADGERFLAHHGQVRSSTNTRPRPIGSAINLTFLNKPIYCEKSNREASKYLLKVLTKEEKDRQTKAEEVSTLNDRIKSSELRTATFDCSSVSCGIWTYVNSDLVFAPQLAWESRGTVKFGERAMMVTFEPNKRIDFRYSSTLGITTEDGTHASFVFSMQEPPLFFERIVIDPILALMAQLGIDAQVYNQPKRNGPERHRIPYLSEEHRSIAGNCLVYRITLTNSSSEVGDRMQSLRNAHGLPPIIHQRTDVSPLYKSYNDEFQKLKATLSSLNVGIPFQLVFQIQKLAQNNYLSPTLLVDMIPEIKKMTVRSDLSVCVSAMRKLFYQVPFPAPDVEDSEFWLKTLIDRLKENEDQCKRVGIDEFTTAKRSENVAIIHRAKVTPAAILLYGPEPESNNRVLRKYADYHEYFLRVQFCDEDGDPVRFNPKISNDKIYNGRFKNILSEGIGIAERTYEFLGFSHSSLRAQTCWFVAPFIDDAGELISAESIIRQLGDFSIIQSPAKCAARIGQAFSDTPVAVKIDPEVVRIVDDVEFKGRVFSDGVGCMSTSIMEKIWDRLWKAPLSKPTCFQIRFSGAKGMISLDSRLQGDVLVLRPSMIKFEGANKTDIEICEAAHRPLPAYLNRQLIKILEDMGVKDSFFLNLQAKEVNRLRMITNNPINASSFLKRQSIGDMVHLPWLIDKLSFLKLDFRRDGFLRDVLELTLLMELRLLKHKTRLPVQKGYHLHGLMDETGILEEGQIFCIVREEGMKRMIVGQDLIITRAPALHPGDVQLVEGVRVPDDSPLLRLSNCIVFSQKGTRDLPSKLSGGDLDGDRYYIIWDEDARPKKTFEPADYPRQDPVDIGRAVMPSDMTNFFVQFMETDQLGRIAVAHRILADQKDAGTLDPDCITLAGMHSTAVDFSKTGIPVDMTKLPRYDRCRPDFEAPGPHVTIEKKDGIRFDDLSGRDPDQVEDDDDGFTHHRYYESEKILGKLYRAIDERVIFREIQQHSQVNNPTHTSTVIHRVWDYVQRQCSLSEWEHHKQWARDIRDGYEECLLNIMTDYSEHPSRPLSELEAFVGNILGRTGAQSKHQRELSTSLKEQFGVDAAFFVNCIIKEGDQHAEDALGRSMACLAVSLEDRDVFKRSKQLVSFKYVAAAVCLRELERVMIF